jgi:hypothetical protein
MISPVFRGDSGTSAATGGDGGATGAAPVGAAGRATLGAGVGGVGLTARSGGGDVDGAAPAVVEVVEAMLSTIPQWTQNFAPGWFSLPQAAHFMTVPPPASARQD